MDELDQAWATLCRLQEAPALATEKAKGTRRLLFPKHVLALIHSGNDGISEAAHPRHPHRAITWPQESADACSRDSPSTQENL